MMSLALNCPQLFAWLQLQFSTYLLHCAQSTHVVSCLQRYLMCTLFATHCVSALFPDPSTFLSSISFSALTAWPFVKLSACENVPKVMAGGVYKTLRAISFIESTQQEPRESQAGSQPDYILYILHIRSTYGINSGHKHFIYPTMVNIKLSEHKRNAIESSICLWQQYRISFLRFSIIFFFSLWEKSLNKF